MSDCSRCGAWLMFSARKRGDGLCGPCSREIQSPEYLDAYRRAAAEDGHRLVAGDGPLPVPHPMPPVGTVGVDHSVSGVTEDGFKLSCSPEAADARHAWVSAMLEMPASPQRTAELRQMIIDAMDVVEQEEDGCRLARALKAFDLPAGVMVDAAPPPPSTFTIGSSVKRRPRRDVGVIIEIRSGPLPYVVWWPDGGTVAYRDEEIEHVGGRWTCVSDCNAGRS